MPNVEDDPDGPHALNRLPRRFYVSRRFEDRDAGIGEVPRMCRFAYQVSDDNGELLFESDNGWEIVLRQTPVARQQLKALFFEDDRSVKFVAFQRFNADGQRMSRESFTLWGEDADSLMSFVGLIQASSLDLNATDGGIRLLPEGVDALLTDDQARKEVFERYREAFVDLMEADVASPEIVAFARRRMELQKFAALLTNAEAFATRRTELSSEGRASGPEDVWQDFFEANQWVFGSALAPQFLHAWNPDRLEETVVGKSIFGVGKRPDAVMRTAGLMSALVFVEIKRHDTPLLDIEYRSGAWRVDKEIAGGVAQCQATVDEVVRRAESELNIEDDRGFRTGESVFICRPRSLLVVGSLDQFMQDGQPNVAMFESFERFRRSLRDPEIVTFDELYQRAEMSLTLARREEDGQDGEDTLQVAVPGVTASGWDPFSEEPF